MSLHHKCHKIIITNMRCAYVAIYEIDFITSSIKSAKL